jgi:hypothetical protein
MTLAKQSGRQDPIVGQAAGAFGDVVSGTYLASVDVPQGAIVTGGGLAITELFDSVTTDKFSIGDKEGAAAAAPATYAVQSADVTVLGTWIPIVPTGHKYASPGSVGIVWTGAGAAPANGKFRLIVQYIKDGRAAFAQG